MGGRHDLVDLANFFLFHRGQNDFLLDLCKTQIKIGNKEADWLTQFLKYSVKMFVKNQEEDILNTENFV